MSDIFIIIIGIISFILILKSSSYEVYNKKINRIVNISLFILQFITPDPICSILFLILILRLIIWLFGPGQDLQDDYYYQRYKNAERRYYKKWNGKY